jgi:hypothetical protein
MRLAIADHPPSKLVVRVVGKSQAHYSGGGVVSEMSGRAGAGRGGRTRVAWSGGRSRRPRVSPRDREVLAWVARQRMVQAEQLAAREWPVGQFAGGGQRAVDPGQLSPETIARLLRSLAQKGLVEGRRFYYADAQGLEHHRGRASRGRR